MADENVIMMKESLADLEGINLPEGYELRTFEPGDEVKWAELMKAVFPESEWTVDKFIKVFASQSQFDPEGLFFIVKGDEYVASALGWYDDLDNKEVGRVHWVGVREEHRGKGLGKAVVLAVLHYLKSRGSRKAILETQEYREPAIKLYESLGFRRI